MIKIAHTYTRKRHGGCFNNVSVKVVVRIMLPEGVQV